VFTPGYSPVNNYSVCQLC